VLLLVVTALSTGGIYVWGRDTIAIPACTAVAKAEGKELVGYRPIQLGVRTRQAPDGECLLQGADGKIVERSLAKHLTGWAIITSFALGYDIVFLVMFVVCGVVLATVFSLVGRG
jgi:hypothetical protein